MGEEDPGGEVPPEEGERGEVVVTINNRFKRANGEEISITATEEVVEVRRFETRPAMVRRGYGMTLNLGDYESARIDVMVEVPCYLADVELAMEWAEKFVEKKLAEEYASVKGRKSSTEKDTDKNGNPY